MSANILIVGNLGVHTSEDDIRLVLKAFDPVDVQISWDRSNGKSTGFCRIVFKDDHDKGAAKATLSKTLLHSLVPKVFDDSTPNLESMFSSENCSLDVGTETPKYTRYSHPFPH